MNRFTAALGAGVSRRDIALSPGVWMLVGLTFGLFAVACAVIPAVIPDVHVDRMRICAAFLAICSVVLLRLPPPEPDTRTTHVTLMLTYIAPTLAVWAFAPHGSLALGAAMFVGPLAAVWMVERRQIVAHLVAAGLVLSLPAALGILDTASVASLVFMIPTIWAVAFACVIVLSAAEQQGDQLTALVRRDPLTGLGNRRLLHEQFDLELARHAATQRPLAVMALDLNGFKALNDTLGHPAGDELLKAVARELERSARRHDTIVRQGGDEFCVLLPDATYEQAEVVAALIRRRLSDQPSFRQGVSTGIGIAAFPNDGDDAETLLDVADERLRDDKSSAPPRGAALSPVDLPAVAVPDTPADPLGGMRALDGLTRREMAVGKPLWRATVAMFLFYPAVGLTLFFLAPDLRNPAFLPVCMAGFATGLLYLLMPAPPIGTVRNHLVVASVYLFPVVVLAATKPAGAMAAGLATWIGPVSAVRLQSRWQIAAHGAAASVALLALPVLGLVGATTTVALLMVCGTFWVLGLCCVVVLEAAEAQGEELARLVRRDPLTGVGNRRLLDERLEQELRAHRISGAHLTVLALDLNGFKALNDTVGHAAGDELLQAVARELTTIVDGQGDVVRQGGDEFAVLLPHCTAIQADGVKAAIRTRLGEIVVAGVPVSTGVGGATFPADAVEAEGLLDCADNRLRGDKYGSHDEHAAPRAERLDRDDDRRTMFGDARARTR